LEINTESREHGVVKVVRAQSFFSERNSESGITKVNNTGRKKRPAHLSIVERLGGFW
jgi:hypothetical protein